MLKVYSVIRYTCLESLGEEINLMSEQLNMIEVSGHLAFLKKNLDLTNSFLERLIPDFHLLSLFLYGMSGSFDPPSETV